MTLQSIQAALDTDCRLLYSDSMPHGLSFESPHGRLSVVDPLSPAHPMSLQEPPAVYRVERQAHRVAAYA